MHKDPCIAFANKGYHILLEKPIAPTLEDCEEIIKVCKRNGIILAVGHVLRYTPHFLKVKELLDSGRIGKEFLICILTFCCQLNCCRKLFNY